jgi:hypothetical protein
MRRTGSGGCAACSTGYAAGPGSRAAGAIRTIDPAGYVGLLYWYLLYPIHNAIFGAMLRGLRRASLGSD